MYYVIRWWMNGKPNEQTFDDLPQARAFLRQLDCHAELFAWLAGREEYMECN